MTKYRCTADATKVRCEVGVGFTSVCQVLVQRFFNMK